MSNLNDFDSLDKEQKEKVYKLWELSDQIFEAYKQVLEFTHETCYIAEQEDGAILIIQKICKGRSPYAK